MVMKLQFVNSVIEIWRIVPDHGKRQIWFLMFLITMATFFEALGLGMVIPLLGAMIPSESSGSYGTAGLLTNILGLFSGYSLQAIVLGVLFLYLLKNAYLAGLVFYQSNLIFKLEARLSKDLLSNYLARPYTFFVDHNSAQMIRNVVWEVSNFCHNALSPLCSLIAEAFIGIGILALLVAVNPYGALIMTFALGFVGALFHWNIRRHVAYWGSERQYHEGMRIQKLQESFGAIKEIKIGDLQSQFCADYARHADGSCTSGRQQYTIQNLPRLLLEVLAVSALVLAILLVQDSERANIVPILGIYAAAAFRLMPSVNRILNALQSIRFAKPSIDVLSRELTKISVQQKGFHHSRIPFEKSIKFKDVTYKYLGQDTPVLMNVNFEIFKGEFVCVSGPSGSGKSTLVDVLCGLLEPVSGEVQVDGLAIKGGEQLWYKHIAFVPQSIFLIDGTIKDNITLGISNEKINKERLSEVIKICSLEELVCINSGGLDAMVGERGARISGGQRQRIGLARELYRSRSLLILDEATSALDNDTEAEILENIRLEKGDTTIIWITHGVAPLRFADKIIDVRDGVVRVESKNIK